jgi:hypothetical protein
LDVETERHLSQAYGDIASRLGPEVVIAPMVADGVEMLLGARLDPQFGPVVLIGFGGIYAEILQDVVFALPPFTAQHAGRCVDRLQLRSMLNGVRGQPAADVEAFCEAAARFSAIIDALRDVVAEVDVNPIIVHERGCTAVDALIITRDS